MSEHQEQVALFEWAELQKCTMPELGLLFAIPNGGQRDAKTGAKMKREGVKRGVPDICLPVARGGFNGMFLEMKFGKNRLTKTQDEWITNLFDAGYFVAVAYGLKSPSDLSKNI